MYIVLGIAFLGISMVCVFVLGGFYTRHIMLEALEEARNERMCEDYYRLAGVNSSSDPKPYVPPTLRPKAPRARILPHMNTLDRLLHEGRRGTIMVRAGDRNKK